MKKFHLPLAFIPKLITVLQEGYSRKELLRDTAAGLIVGTVALPLAIAFGIASGVTPEQGLITAIVAGFIISALSGSRVQIGGPTGAFVVVIYGVVQKFGLQGLLIATILSGVVVTIMGLVKLGGVIKFIPAPVITGFTSGIAVIIFSSQMRDLFGLQMKSPPADFIEKWSAYSEHFGTINLAAVGIAIAALLIIIYSPRFIKKIPSPFIALVIMTAVVQIFSIPVATIGSTFGALPTSLPSPEFPKISMDMIRALIPSVITMSILIAIESLLSAIVADGMLGTKHRSNMELVAQGAANIITPIFGGIPATGAIARTATNIKSGGRSPIAGIVHSLMLLIILLAAGKYAALIPMPVLAAILVVVSYNMSEWRTFRSMLKSPRSDVVILLVTFFLTVILDLTIAIEVGMVLAAFLFMNRMSQVTNVKVITNELNDSDDSDQPIKLQLPAGTQLYEINGPFFFGAAEKFTETIRQMGVFPKILIIRMRNVTAIDATGIKVLDDIRKQASSKGTRLIITDIHSQPYLALEKSGYFEKLGDDNIQPTLEECLRLLQS